MSTSLTEIKQLKSSIQEHIAELKASKDDAVREHGVALDVEFNDFMGRAIGATRLAVQQRKAAHLEQVQLLEILDRIDSSLVRGALQALMAPDDVLAG